MTPFGAELNLTDIDGSDGFVIRVGLKVCCQNRYLT